jgi:hypothetical protein
MSIRDIFRMRPTLLFLAITREDLPKGMTILNKYVPALWILGGVLLMLLSIIGNDRSELIPIGIVFMVVGITSNKKRQHQEIQKDRDKNSGARKLY